MTCLPELLCPMKRVKQSAKNQGIMFAELIESNIDYIFLAGGHKISRRTISDFRRKNADKLQKILTSTAIKSIEVGLVKTDGIFSLDGSKCSADASKSKTKTKKGWEDVRKKLEIHVEEFLTVSFVLRFVTA